jgi:hypothetical protein
LLFSFLNLHPNIKVIMVQPLISSFLYLECFELTNRRCEF